jgi:hypothetical protein
MLCYQTRHWPAEGQGMRFKKSQQDGPRLCVVRQSNTMQALGRARQREC